MAKQLLFILILMGLCTFSLSAEDSKPPETEKTEKSISRRFRSILGKRTPNRLSPSRILLEGVISDEGITFLPAEWYTSLFVTITHDETGDEWSGLIANPYDVIPFDGTEGSYSICVQTTEGSLLYGSFELYV